MRIAIVELLFIKDAPMKVVVDEALELAKKYSTEAIIDVEVQEIPQKGG